MPKVTVYIRKDDYQAWKSVQAKTTFVHNALKQVEGIDGIGLLVDDRTNVVTLDEPPKRATKPLEDVLTVFPKAKVINKVKLCKHGNPLGECFDRKADRSCKL